MRNMNTKTIPKQSTTLFKFVVYILITQLIWSILIFSSNAEKLKETSINSTNFNSIKFNSIKSYLRKQANHLRILSVNTVATEKVDCSRDTSNNCVCPGSCMTHSNNNSYCVVKNCFTWVKDNTENKGICKATGHDHLAPIILSSIPFTSVLGINYAIIERWDLFGMQLGVLLGPCCLLCCLCVLVLRENDKNEDALSGPGCYELFTRCFSCCWAVALIMLWIMSIVWTATPGNITDGDGCPLVF